jgi:hypothetical protein
MVFVDVSLSFFFSKKESDAALVAVWKRDINNYKEHISRYLTTAANSTWS